MIHDVWGTYAAADEKTHCRNSQQPRALSPVGYTYLSTDFPHFTDKCLEQRALRNVSDREQDYWLNSL